MHNSPLNRILTELGLSENETRVYLAALSLGPSSVLALARATEIRRTTVYTIIDSLKKKGLMFVEPRGFKQVFVAEHPEKLLAIVDHKKRDLEAHFPDLLSLYNLKGGQSTLKYYEGLASIKSIYDTILGPMKAGDDYLVISNLQALVDMDPDYFKKYLDKRAASRVKARLIATDSKQARYMQKYSAQMNHEVRILPPGTELSVDIMIVPHKVTIFNLEHPLTGMSIENPATIRAQQEMFEIMWRGLGAKN